MCIFCCCCFSRLFTVWSVHISIVLVLVCRFFVLWHGIRLFSCKLRFYLVFRLFGWLVLVSFRQLDSFFIFSIFQYNSSQLSVRIMKFNLVVRIFTYSKIWWLFFVFANSFRFFFLFILISRHQNQSKKKTNEEYRFQKRMTFMK